MRKPERCSTIQANRLETATRKYETGSIVAIELREECVD
jgi:hypothetical protein